MSAIVIGPVIHQVARVGFPEELPKNEQAVLIHKQTVSRQFF
jgi:hypothetical protein